MDELERPNVGLGRRQHKETGPIPARTSATKCLLKQNLIAELKLPSHLVFAPSN
jgi:hypothetical protein